MHGFYNSLRMELTQHGVSVSVICPWWVVTEFHTAQLTKDGMPRGETHGRDMYTDKMMSAERCAVITLKAAHKRRREVLMGPGALAVWLKAARPGFCRLAGGQRFHEDSRSPLQVGPDKEWILTLELVEFLVRWPGGLLTYTSWQCFRMNSFTSMTST